ncbi:MAG: transporter substrate-binding domain-containing protein [Maritalea sp.]
MMLKLKYPLGLCALSVLLFAALASLANAQSLPKHVDPSAFEDVLDLSLVPSIRFLTTSDFPPFNYRGADGEVVGFNVELAEALCKEIGAECTLQSWPWDQVGNALVDGQGDAIIAGLGVSEVNAAKFEFSKTYLALPGRFVVKAGTQDEVGFDPHQLKGAIGVQRGSAHHAFLKKHFSSQTILPLAGEFEVLDGLRIGTIDIAFVDGMRASFWLNQNQCCVFIGGPYFSVEDFGAGLAIAVNPNAVNVRRAIDIGLTRLSKSGKLDELYLKWFPVGFY